MASSSAPAVNTESLKSEIRSALINNKAFACPIAARCAWHAAGTFDARDGTGGSDGAHMRFEPEISDPANAGLTIVHDLLHKVKKEHPEISIADLWTFAGSQAIELMGGPKIPHRFGRTDDADGARCPAHGRLPDAAQGADHLRSVFGRMGFDDREIVALSGAHTVGRCHRVRSGFDGPWTHNPLRFDNAYFRNLVNLEWVPRKWDGPLQFTDTATGRLMMLPTDMALVQDAKFRVFVELYAKDQDVFFKDFANVFAKLLSLGCPAQCDPFKLQPDQTTDRAKASAEFRELAMHGSEEPMKALVASADVHAVDPATKRSALHFAAFWGHENIIRYLATDLKLNVNAIDSNGDTPLHDAARFGHKAVAECLASVPGANLNIVNKEGFTPLGLAIEYGKTAIAELLRGYAKQGRL